MRYPARARVPGLLSLAALLLAGCAAQPGLAPPVQPEPLDAVPFFPQTAWQCGPAALATVLVHGGVATTPEALADGIYLPGRQGSLQLELIARSRRLGRVPWVLPPEPQALWAELAAGSPVLVLQDLGALGVRRWHYAVVVGFDGQRQQVVLRSGTERERREPLRRFMKSWQRGGYWALVVPPPERLPVTIDAMRWARVLLDSAEVMAPPALDGYWDTAAGRWPDEFLVQFAAANHEFGRGQLPAAERRYRQLAARGQEEALVRNNLANLLLERGCPSAALDEALTAQAVLPESSPWESAITATLVRARSAAASAADQDGCDTPR
jgi:hypothetical protein